MEIDTNNWRIKNSESGNKNSGAQCILCVNYTFASEMTFPPLRGEKSSPLGGAVPGATGVIHIRAASFDIFNSNIISK